MGLPEQGFPASRRIRTSAEYRHLRRVGKRCHTRNFTVYIADRNNDFARLGLTVSRKVGGAVRRNRVKRLVREFFRLHQPHLKAGTDISVVAKPGAARLEYEQVCEELSFLIRHNPTEKFP